MPSTVTNIKSSNRQNGYKEHLCVPKEVQLEVGKIIVFMLSQVRIYVICKESKLEAVGVKTTNKFLDNIGEHIKPMGVVETCDCSHISHAGYMQCYLQAI